MQMTFSDDDINLRPYILTLVRQWWKIALLATISAFVALIFTLSQPRKYEATATIMVTRQRATLTLANQFPTVSDPVDTNSRMNAMLSIAQSDSLALQVIQSLGDALSIRDKNLEAFKEFVKVTNNGDLISVVGTAREASFAAEIANAWAREAVQAINRAYSGEQPLDEIQKQSQAVQKQYETAQAALETAIQENQSDLLRKQIEESQKLFTDLADDRAWLIDYYDRRKQDMQMLVTQAGALKQQIEGGSYSTAGNLGDALAVLIARASMLGLVQQTASEKTVGMGSGLSITLQLSDPNLLKDTAGNYAADLSVLIKQAEEEKAASETALENLTQSVNKGEGKDQIEAVAVNIQALKAQLERQEARLHELTSERDLAWKTYQAMLEKEAEIQNAPQNNEVILAVPAIEAQTPAPRGSLRNTAAAGAMGLILGVFWVIVVEWWRSSDASRPQVTSSVSRS